MKQLLAISWEMPPLSGPRAVQVTRTLTALGALGWHSRVVCFDPKSRRYQQDYQVPVEQVSQGTVVRLPVPSPEESVFFRALWRLCPPLKHQPDEKRVWLPGALAEARRALADKPADVIVSFAQPWTDHLAGLRLHRETGVPWVAHFSDPWVDSPYMTTNAWARRNAADHERSVIAEASRVVFVNRYTRDQVMAKYPDEWMSRARVIPQGFEPLLHSPVAATGVDRPLHLVYSGRFYDGIRTPDTFLDAVAAIHRVRPLEGRLDVEFVGGGMAAYERRAKSLGIGTVVRFSGRVDPVTARERAAAADALLIIDAPSAGPGLFLPSKLVDYLPLRRPILGLVPVQGPSADLIGALGYPVIDPRDTAGIATTIERLVETFHSARLGPSRQHDEVAADYTVSATTLAFGAVLDEALRHG